jgi:hypothetical protein
MFQAYALPYDYHQNNAFRFSGAIYLEILGLGGGLNEMIIDEH